MKKSPLAVKDPFRHAGGLPTKDFPDFKQTNARHLRALAVGKVFSTEDIAKLLREIKKLQKQKDELEKLANTDALTGLNNRRVFNKTLQRMTDEINQEMRQDDRRTRGQAPRQTPIKDFALILMDLDGFKVVNDTFGHDFGDRVLKGVAKLILGKSIRPSDFLARIGGEEFAIIVPAIGDVPPEVAIKSILDRIEVKRQKTFIPTGRGDYLSIGISAGVHYARPGDTVEDIFKSADSKLYEAKDAKGEARRVLKLSSSPAPGGSVPSP
ncbi:MAG: diguanylate cyclase [Alphaproteobacteria bacterium]|nr:diguanylate cyclase [Alphaproteobacteria bacterium]